MSKIDEKTRKQLINAMERAKEYHLQQKLKMEEKLWMQVEAPYRLIDALPLLTKYELDDIRKQLELSGMSSLKKAELAVELARTIPIQFEKVISNFDKERYDLIKTIIKNMGMLSVDDGFPISKIASLRDHGVVFPVLKDGQKHLMVPAELIDLFDEVDGAELQERIRQNTEWIRLVHGMAYYYGVINSSKMIEKIESLTKSDIDIRKYSQAVRLASDYYQQIRIRAYSSGGYIVDESIYNVEDIIKEHNSRPDIDYYPFTKNQLLSAGEPGFIDKSPEMVKFLRFLSESYDLTAEDKDEIAEELIYMINSNDQPSKLLEYLQSIFELPSFEFVQQLTAHVMEVYNNTRMWALKGYKPMELRKEKEKHSKPMPAHPFNQPQDSSNVIDLNTRRKVGRNDPCSCGSGKKYKKCCGK